MLLAMPWGLKQARETVESVGDKITESADTIARGIAAAIGIALAALLVAVIALVKGAKVRAA